MMETKDLLDQVEFDSLYTYDGRKVPRVTTILSSIHEEYLMRWANYLGFKHKDYNSERESAAVYGTITHKAIEDELNGVNPTATNMSFSSFKLWWERLTSNNRVEVLGQEETLVSQFYGGTYDLLLRINDKIYLVDFKTSNRIGFKYCLQLSAYRNMIYASKGIAIDGMIILQLPKNKLEYKEYVIDLSIPNHLNFANACGFAFDKIAEGYWWTEYIRQQFDSFRWA